MNKWDNYAQTYIEEVVPEELKGLYDQLLKIRDNIDFLQSKLAFAKNTNSDVIQIETLTLNLHTQQQEYTKLHQLIVKEKKRLGNVCSWEKK